METINVNLSTCARFEHCSDGDHDPVCPKATPVLIPCPIPRSVTFTVRLGKCDCPGNFGMGKTKREDMEHTRSCPARPIRVSCSISGKTWEESEVFDIDKSGEPFDSNLTYESALAACRERWALVKALVLGQRITSPSISPALLPAAGALFDERAAVFGALADMARAEEATWCAVGKLPGRIAAAVTLRESEVETLAEIALQRYVAELIEQVGVLP